MLSGVGAYAAVSLLVGSDRHSSALASGAPVWLGVKTVSVPFGGGGLPSGGGALVSGVVSGSPAAAAGLQPGDVIIQIDNRPVASSTDVKSAIAGMRAGSRVEIQYDRGPIMYTTQATLQARPTGSP